MSDPMKDPDALTQLYDPGEVGRAEHNRGDRFVVGVSNAVAWLFPLLMLAITAQVILRQAGHNQAWLDDLQWWLYGIACLTGIAYAVTTGSHVRVDIFYDNFPKAKQDRLNIFALGWLFLPFIILTSDFTFHYAVSSVVAREGSDSPNGLHNLWILKVLMFLAFVFIGVSIVAALLRHLARLTTVRLWKVLVAMLPATWFLINLALYYALWWGVRLTSGPDVSDRQVTRHPAFGAVELGQQEILYTVIASGVLTAVLILATRAMARKEG